MRKKDHPLYNTWNMMRQRCNNPRFHKYPIYGGRGVKICAEWSNFWQFVADVGERPAKHTLDRYPDKDGDYTPENTRWATFKQQAANRRARRDHKMITYNGITKHQAAWAAEYGLSAGVISNRIKRGWSIARSLTTPTNPVGTNQHSNHQP